MDSADDLLILDSINRSADQNRAFVLRAPIMEPEFCLLISLVGFHISITDRMAKILQEMKAMQDYSDTSSYLAKLFKLWLRLLKEVHGLKANSYVFSIQNELNNLGQLIEFVSNKQTHAGSFKVLISDLADSFQQNKNLSTLWYYLNNRLHGVFLVYLYRKITLLSQAKLAKSDISTKVEFFHQCVSLDGQAAHIDIHDGTILPAVASASQNFSAKGCAYPAGLELHCSIDAATYEYTFVAITAAAAGETTCFKKHSHLIQRKQELADFYLEQYKYLRRNKNPKVALEASRIFKISVEAIKKYFNVDLPHSKRKASNLSSSPPVITINDRAYSGLPLIDTVLKNNGAYIGRISASRQLHMSRLAYRDKDQIAYIEKDDLNKAFGIDNKVISLANHDRKQTVSLNEIASKYPNTAYVTGYLNLTHHNQPSTTRLAFYYIPPSEIMIAEAKDILNQQIASLKKIKTKKDFDPQVYQICFDIFKKQIPQKKCFSHKYIDTLFTLFISKKPSSLLAPSALKRQIENERQYQKTINAINKSTSELTSNKTKLYRLKQQVSHFTKIQNQQKENQENVDYQKGILVAEIQSFLKSYDSKLHSAEKRTEGLWIVSTLPPEDIPIETIYWLYRDRWAIESNRFKKDKSYNGLSAPRSANPSIVQQVILFSFIGQNIKTLMELSLNEEAHKQEVINQLCRRYHQEEDVKEIRKNFFLSCDSANNIRKVSNKQDYKNKLCIAFFTNCKKFFKPNFIQQYLLFFMKKLRSVNDTIPLNITIIQELQRCEEPLMTNTTPSFNSS